MKAILLLLCFLAACYAQGFSATLFPFTQEVPATGSLFTVGFSANASQIGTSNGIYNAANNYNNINTFTAPPGFNGTWFFHATLHFFTNMAPDTRIQLLTFFSFSNGLNSWDTDLKLIINDGDNNNPTLGDGVQCLTTINIPAGTTVKVIATAQLQSASLIQTSTKPNVVNLTAGTFRAVLISTTYQ